MKKLAVLVFCAVVLSSCQAGQLVRIPLGGLSDDRPEISSIVDLGSLSIPVEGELNQTESDGRFISGEWVALVGKGLNTEGARLYLDGAEVPIKGGIKGGGLIFRLPRDLKFRHSYNLHVETPRGTAKSSLSVTNLLVMGDPKGDQVLFWRTSSEKKLLFEEESLSVASDDAGPHTVARSGGILYVTGKGKGPRREGLSRFELKTVHLGGKYGPTTVSSINVEAKFEPVSLATTDVHLFLLTNAEVLVFDLSDQENPKFLSRQELPLLSKDISFRDLVFLGDGTKAAVLEQASNQIFLVDFSKPAAPAILYGFPVVPATNGSCSIALEPDRSDPNSFWLLAGLNTQQLRKRLSSLWSDTGEDTTPTRASLYRIELKENTLVAGEPVQLPEGVMAFGLFSEKSGDVLISGLGYEKEKLAKADLSLRGAASLLKGAWDSIFAGRVYRVTRDRMVTNEFKSMKVVLSMAKIENSPLVYSSYRLATKYVMPSVDVVFSADIHKVQSFKVREVDWKSILPPYKFFPDITLL